MKKLRIILLYKIIIISFFLTILLTIYRLNINIKKYDSTIIGTITSIKEKDTYKIIELSGKENIIIYDNNEYKLGEKLKVTGTLSIPNNNTIFNLFNYRKYLLSKNIKYVMIPKKIEKLNNDITIKYKIKNKLIEYINTYNSKTYLKTFILGDNNDIEDNIIKSYQLNGISHLFAVSGMHLSLFALIIIFILKKLNIKELYITIITILLFTFFAFLTDYTPSILRALLMYSLLSINKLLNLKIKTIYILLITLELLLLYNPFYVYNIGFLFSYTTSTFLILNNKLISKEKNYIKKTLITSIIAQLSSIPIQINNYFSINVLAPLINIIFVPFISFIIFPLSLLTLLIKPLDNIFLNIIKILEFLSLKLENINITIILCHIPIYIIILYYILIIIFIIGIREKNIKLFIPLILLIIIHTNIKNIININRITSLDVGQGDSILIEQNKENILIDTGGNVNKDIVLSKTIPYLKSLGITKLDFLILTHGDFDHMGEAINLVSNYKVEKVIFNCGPYNYLEQELIKLLDKKHIKYHSCIKELNIDKNKLYFLQTKEYDNENDNSNVIYTEINGFKFMFMGDASITTEKEIIDKYNLPDIDVLKVGHHGSRTSSSKEFINEINPKYSIISVGKNNRYGHPNEEVLNNLENTKIYRTDQDGSIMLKIKNNKLKIETCSL